jgi:hypothetical protein
LIDIGASIVMQGNHKVDRLQLPDHARFEIAGIDWLKSR